MNPRAMRPGKKYRIVHQTEAQRFARVSVMTFLDEDYAGRPRFNARPAASTQTLEWAHIKHVSPSSQANHSINGRLPG